MVRLMTALVVVLGVLSSATANVSGQKNRSLFDKPILDAKANGLSPFAVCQVLAPRGRPEFQLTEESEVQLDGRACKYKDLPANVSIIRIEVGPDNKTIQKIYFRTRK